MKIQPKSINILSFIVMVIFISSCTSSKKFDFASAYKFRTIKHNLAEDTKPAELNEEKLTTSTEITTQKDITAELSDSQKKILQEMALMKGGESLSENELKERVQSLDKKEKKKLRKELMVELKSEMKNLKSMEKNDISSTSKTSELVGYTRTGVIIGAIGVIVLILGAIFGVGALTAAGAILIIGGVVFILIDVI